MQNEANPNFFVGAGLRAGPSAPDGSIEPYGDAQGWVNIS